MEADIFGLTGKVALIVGGGQGLGEATLRYLSGAGCDIAIVDLSRERAEAVAAEVRQQGRSAAVKVADVTEEGALEEIVAWTEAEFGGLDVVASIVGQAKFGGVLEFSPDDWDRDHARNLRYFFFLCQAAARSFVRRDVGGSIVGMSSAGALGSMPFRAAYGANKAGLSHLVKSLAVELGEYGVRINAVAPGLTLTPRIAARMSAEAVAQQSAEVPLGRLGVPDDIAKAVLFLASDLAAHITGVTLAVDGGSTAAPRGDLEPSRAASRRNRAAMGREL
jgi:NAD(P)-dependent dehydrogenase (short-subunit alcohol dehydrogenase family)